ncbi:MAG: hypothetical protein KDH93_19185 [Rhodoferax sp.]|nr:hypothetical protein [Rhodoferax sp.]MCB2007149.1 hypothetical protein [Rhodoferax sp.]MCB2027793.1 hypothetical protein [Rhodoferax sp.]MCP5262402.1 hypothetical protein [Rhodoferax sp.]
MSSNKKESGTHPDRLDWMAADLRGEERDLAWYLEAGAKGDRDAARRALQLIVDSLSDAGLKATGMKIPHTLLQALRAVIEPLAQEGDSRLLRAFRGQVKGRPIDPRRRNTMWWLCVRLHQLLASDPTMTQIIGAEQVLDDAMAEDDADPDVTLPGAEALVLQYRRDREAVATYLRADEVK